MAPGLRRIDEWKGIAAHFECSIRTVQRWHKDLEMPVYRDTVAGKGRVYAYAEELDAWKARQRVLEEEALAAAHQKGRDRRSILYAGGGVFAALAALLLLLDWDRKMIPVETPVTSGRVFWRARAEGRTVESVKLPGVFDLMEIGADSRTLYGAEYRKSDLHVVDTGKPAVRTVALPEPILKMKMSPDGKTLFVATGPGDVLLLEPRTFEVKQRVSVGGPVNDIAVAPDSDTVFLAAIHRGVKKYVVSDNELTPVTSNPCPYFLTLSPRADQLAVSYQCGGPLGREGHDSVELFDTKTGKSQHVFAGQPMVGGGPEYAPSGELLWVDAMDGCVTEKYDRAGCPQTPTYLYQVFQLSPPRLLKSVPVPTHGNRPLFLSDRAVLTREKLITILDPVRFTVRERVPPDVHRSGVTAVALSRDRSRLFVAYSQFDKEPVHALWRIGIEPPLCALPEKGIVHFLPFDGAGEDYVENANVTSPAGLGFAPGLIAQALRLESGREVSLHSPADLQFPADSSTLAFFVKPTGSPANLPLLEKAWRENGAGWSLRLSEEAKPVLELMPLEGERRRLTFDIAVSENVWTHLAFVRNGDTFGAYVNGQPAGSRTAPGIDVRTWARPIRVGPFAGLLDEFAMWARGFSAEEVKGMYERRLAAPCRP